MNTRLVSFWVVLLCLDSLVKIPLGGMHAHVFLFLIPLYFVINMALHGRFFAEVKRIADDRPVVLLVVYVLLHGWLAIDSNVYFILLLYLLLFVFVYLFVLGASISVNWGLVGAVAIVVLVITGLWQWVLANLFDHQIELRGLDRSYYEGKGGIGERMRGFFLEPNWYGLALMSWWFVYVSSAEGALAKVKIPVSALVLLCLLLSGNRLTVTLFVGLALSAWIGAAIERRKRLMLLISMTVLVISYFSLSFKYQEIQDRSAAARLYTAANVVEVMGAADTVTKLVGFGFSNWGHYSNQWGLAWSNPKQDQELVRRDNAEVYVFIFEMGLLVVLLAAYDLVFVSGRSVKVTDTAFVACIYVVGFFYPLYTFMFYLVPLMIVRGSVLRARSVSALNK